MPCLLAQYAPSEGESVTAYALAVAPQHVWRRLKAEGKHSGCRRIEPKSLG